ncbi:hypothetical protein LZ31DRAFT_318296 [Colletotrichum somersetense]|nr:hypothetical protein LZ31DRAFT_318296 [Colletotrichum somersetense]
MNREGCRIRRIGTSAWKPGQTHLRMAPAEIFAERKLLRTRIRRRDLTGGTERGPLERRHPATVLFFNLSGPISLLGARADGTAFPLGKCRNHRRASPGQLTRMHAGYVPGPTHPPPPCSPQEPLQRCKSPGQRRQRHE